MLVGQTLLEPTLSPYLKYVSINSSISVSLRCPHESISAAPDATWLAANDGAIKLFDIEPAKFPVNPMMMMVEMAMQDAAAFHAALAAFASVWASSPWSDLQLEPIYHKVECARIVSSRLDGHGTPSEGTICATMWLWELEVRTYEPCRILITDYINL